MAPKFPLKKFKVQVEIAVFSPLPIAIEKSYNGGDVLEPLSNSLKTF
jgi:hypothetical protein